MGATVTTNDNVPAVAGIDQRLRAVEDLVAGAESPIGHPAVPVQSVARLMIVDDEPINIKVVRRYLQLGGYQHFVTTSDSANAMAMFREEVPDVVILDLMMPEVSGLEILKEIREDTEQGLTPILVLTATEDHELKLSALELGATDFLRKPVDRTDLVPRVRNALSVKSFQDHLQVYAKELERQVQERTAELEASRLEVIYCLARAAEFRDNQTGRHVIRVGRYVGEIAKRLGLKAEEVSLLQLAAPLHDMGKIGIPDAVLLKPGRLDGAEFDRMKKHAEFGHDIVSTADGNDWGLFSEHTSRGAGLMQASRSPLLKLAASIAMTHHEKWDGSGYPKGLKGEAIPIEGRMTAVADVFDALGSKRTYKLAFPLEKCLKMIREGRGSHFDPQIVDAFFEALPEITQIREQLTDDH